MPLLANDAYRETLEVARFERDYKVMAQAHNEIHRFMKKAMQQENVVRKKLNPFWSAVRLWGQTSWN